MIRPIRRIRPINRGEVDFTSPLDGGGKWGWDSSEGDLDFHEKGASLTLATEPPDDDVLVHCRRLGNGLPFSYCRMENRGLPCFKILDCWYERFLVEDHLRRELSPEEWAEVFQRPPRPRVLTLLDLIEKAKGSEEA